VSRISLYGDLGYVEIRIDIMNKSKRFIHLAGKTHDFSLSTIDLVKIMSEVINKLTKILKPQKLFVRFLAKFGDFLPIPINSERLLKLIEYYLASNLKIKKAIQKKLSLSSKGGIKKIITLF